MLPPEGAIGPRIKRISVCLDRMRTRDFEELELTSTQGSVLGYLVRMGDRCVYPGDLCKRFSLTHPTVSGVLQRLEAKGFLTYGQDDDRRKKRILITDKALECHQEILSRIARSEALLTQGLTPAQRQQLLELLELVQQNIQAAGQMPCCEKEEPHV